MHPVYAALLYAVRANFLAEAGGVAGKRAGQGIFIYKGIYKAAYHAVLAGADKVKVLVFYLIHHAFHFGKAHNAAYNAAADHEGRHAIGEALVYHKVARVAQYGAVQAGNVPLEVIEAVSAHAAGGVYINAVHFFHYVHMVGYFVIRHDGFAEAFALHVLAVVLADGYGFIYYVGNYQHTLADFGLQFRFARFQGGHLVLHGLNFFLGLLGLVAFSAGHHAAYLLGKHVALVAQHVPAGVILAPFLVHGNDFIHHNELFILKLFAYVFLHKLRVIAYKLNIKHSISPLC